MKKHCFAWSRGRAMAMKVFGGVSILALAFAGMVAAEVSKPVKPALLEAYGKLPLSFEANDGQADPQVKFLSRGRGYTLFLTSTEAVLVLREGGSARNVAGGPPAAKRERGKALRGNVLRIRFVGANPVPAVAGVGELPGRSSYFVGNDPKKWRANVPTYAKVEYRDVYPGVNLVYYGNQRQLEYDFVVSPGADSKAITLAFDGVDGAAIDGLGDLVLRADGSEVRLRKPVVYQEHDGRRAVIPTRYVLKAERQVAFEVAAYDATKPLIIDPVLAYSTYLGGSADDQGLAIAVDAQGNAYVTGDTGSADFLQGDPFPTTSGAFRTTPAGIFVTKLNADGSALLYSSYLGAAGSDFVSGIAVDAAGNAYVTGFTDSGNAFRLDAPFPTTPNAFQEIPGGSGDAFVTKLNATGSALIYSTFLGGDGFDDGFAIAVDPNCSINCSAYVTGQTFSPNFPTTPTNAFRTALLGADAAFVTKLNATGSALVYSTYLGGSGDDFNEGFAIAVDAQGNAYVTGSTTSPNFPTTSGAFQTIFGGCGTCFFPVADAFVAKVNTLASGFASLVYSTFLGGSDDDGGSGIAVDAAGNAYVTGSTASADFPTVGAFQPGFGGSFDAFVTKLNATGTALVYSTFLGGGDDDFGSGIAVDAAGNAYMTGSTASADFPVTVGAFQLGFGGSFDAFVTKLDATGAALVYSTYLGGTGNDDGFGIAVDAAGNAYVTGQTNSPDFPTTPGAFQTTLSPSLTEGFEHDAFVAKLAEINTLAGSNVPVQPVDLATGNTPVTLTFSTVTRAGVTGLVTSATGPPPPVGFKPGRSPTYYDITTTAAFSPSVSVCIVYPVFNFSNEASPTLFHFQNPNWVDVTVSRNIATRTICSSVNSLSPFAIFEPEIQIQPFAAFHAGVEIEDERDEREFKVKGTFTLGAGSDGIHPDTEVATLKVGTFSATIPAGSFRRDGHGTFKFEGDVGVARLKVKIQARGGNRFEFKAEGKGADLTGTTSPVVVTLTIGNDGGNTIRVKAKLDD